MKTTLPELSYNPTGVSWCEEMHSSPYTKFRAHPQTDLEDLVPWVGFERDIHCAITTRMDAMNIAPNSEYDIGSMPKARPTITNEAGVRMEANRQLLELVVEVLQILGVEGRFMFSESGDNQIIGEPDFSWLANSESSQRPKVIVRILSDPSVSDMSAFNDYLMVSQAKYNTKWAAPLKDLPGYFRRGALNRCSVLEQQSVDAVHQLYGYLTLNEAEYGVLSNLQHAWFFQRVEGKTLRYFGPVDFDSHSTCSPSMLKAFVGIVLLAEVRSSSHTPLIPRPRSHTALVNEEGFQM